MKYNPKNSTLLKSILCLMVIFITSSLSAKELKVNVIEGWKSTPVANVTVIVRTKVGIKIREAKTDSFGVVVFSGIKKGLYSIEAKSPKIEFTDGHAIVKIKLDNSVTTILPHTKAYEKRQVAIEDSIYGVFNSKLVDASTPDSLFNEATFSGGVDAMRRFIQQSVIYPEFSKELGDQGRVYVMFLVEPDGVVTHVRIMRGQTRELDEEAKRLVRAMPKWNPGTVEGKEVRALCRLPITFTLQ